MIKSRQEAVKHLAELNWKKKLIDQFGDDIQQSCKIQRTALKFTSFCSELEPFVSLVIKIEFKLFHIEGHEDAHFLKLKLRNQLENVKELKVWMDEREREITKAIFQAFSRHQKESYC